MFASAQERSAIAAAKTHNAKVYARLREAAPDANMRSASGGKSSAKKANQRMYSQHAGVKNPVATQKEQQAYAST